MAMKYRREFRDTLSEGDRKGIAAAYRKVTYVSTL